MYKGAKLAQPTPRTIVLAKALDPDGSGVVSKEYLFAFCENLGIGNRTRQRWLTGCVALVRFSYKKR